MKNKDTPEAIMERLNLLAKKANAGDKNAAFELNALLKNNSEIPKSIRRLLYKAFRQKQQKEIAAKHQRSKSFGSIYTCLSGHTSPQSWRKTK
ncbi:MAG: hypothetical protein E6Q75_07065 [Rheinheimera sp.]|nr:MAG: hypothetical protein E6Q75_07065 [Rheinheimera sp.]